MGTSELSELQRKIVELKEEKNALLIVHNYQIPEIQEIGDFIGDSLQLSRRAQEAGDVDLIECHGTGTPVGDAAEMQSLKTLWGRSGWSAGQCALGSVKSQIGQNMGAIFGCPVSVKAKTTEGLGASGDSMSAYAVALLVPKGSKEKKA